MRERGERNRHSKKNRFWIHFTLGKTEKKKQKDNQNNCTVRENPEKETAQNPQKSRQE